ncbi:type-F conjugative transfer system secretin TraK, partial [Streptomyces brasiliscabiei]
MPVTAGTLRVQVLGEYRGVTLVGKIVRLENRGSRPVTLREDAVAPADAIAVSIAHAELAPGQVTTAYIVEAWPSPGGRR